MKRVLFFLLMIFVSFGVIADCEIQAKDHDCFTIFLFLSMFSVSDIIGVRIDSKYIMAIIIWLYFLSGGYIQWFVLSKRIINK